MDKEEMTLKEVIETLQVWISTADDEYDREEMGRVCGLKEALHEIKKIKPCEDAISRSDAIRVASGFCHWSNIPDELAKLPSVNTIPCEDIISRQAEIGTVDEVVDESVDECHFLCQWNSGSRCTKNPNERNCHKRVSGEVGKGESNVLEQTCHTCKHYFHGKYDGSCYICNRYSNWKSEVEQ